MRARPDDTCRQLVHRYLPLASDKQVMFILWNMTPWPCWDPRLCLRQLRQRCAPVRKRGWYRKLMTEAARIDAEMWAACR